MKPKLMQLLQNMDIVNIVDPIERKRAYTLAIKEYIKGEKARIYQWHLAKATGKDIVTATTALIDEVILAVFELVVKDELGIDGQVSDCAVLATGGYGRGEMNPCSDIDLLFLYAIPKSNVKSTESVPVAIPERTQKIARGILYYLWDVGFQLGHSLKSIDECLSNATSDVIAKTAFMESRFLAGNIDLFASLKRQLFHQLFSIKKLEEYIFAKLDAMYHRHQEYGNSIYQQEPNVKESCGGLRDFHTAIWIAQARFGIQSFDELQHQGIITEAERKEIETAVDFLWRVRNHLHYLTGKKRDSLTFDLQEQIATVMGYTDDLTGSAVEQFMRHYYLFARDIAEFTEIIIHRSYPMNRFRTATRSRMKPQELEPGIRLADGEISLTEPNRLLNTPQLVLRLFYQAQRKNCPISIATKTILRQRIAEIDHQVFLGKDGLKTFRQMLRGKGNLGYALRTMHELGILERIIPEFGALTCLVRQDIHHQYTVDEHSIRAVEYLQELKHKPNDASMQRFGDGSPIHLFARSSEQKVAQPVESAVMVARQIYQELNESEVLILATLLHDIGKSHTTNTEVSTDENEHTANSLKVLPQILDRLHIQPEKRDLIYFLIQHHLLMSDIAQHRDFDEDRILRQFANLVGDSYHLKLLFLITYADMRAVGPQVWNHWKSALLLGLYHRTLAKLEGKEIIESDEQQAIEELKTELITQYKDTVTTEEITEHFRLMPIRYLLGTAPAKIIEHIQLVRKLLTPVSPAGLRLPRKELALIQPELPAGSPVSVTAVSHNFQLGYTDIIICTFDAPGVFSKITGTLAAKMLNILSAQIYTRADGIVLDTIQIDQRSASWTEDQYWWQEIDDELNAVISGKKDIEKIIAIRRRQEMLKPIRTFRIPTEIELNPDISDTQTVIDIRTQDRLGLLYQLTSTMSSLGLNITSARIATYGARAVDVFYVTDRNGNKITDPSQLNQIKLGLLDSLQS
ncbi:MAG: HD domain-containing protein [bacterium]|nr:HD domain-containing protein [bacterium]